MILMNHPIVLILWLLRPTSEMCIFYADYHDVDEDHVIIPLYGGYWPWGEHTESGIFICNMMNIYFYNTSILDYVASLRK